MNIFISYSVKDISLIQKISDELENYATMYWWDQSKELGEIAWKSINKWIDNSDLVLAVITDNVVSKGLPVGQEIGRAVAKSKKVIPFVTPGIDQSELGCLNGITYQRLDEKDPFSAIEAIKKEIRKALPKSEESSGIDSFWVIAGLIGLVIWANKE